MGKKWSGSRPAEKLLSLYTLLLTSSQPVRLTELSRLLNCAKQSVTRLIDQLESSHFGKIVRHQLGRQVAYSLDRPRHRPCTSLDAEGLRQLALCRELLLHFLFAGNCCCTSCRTTCTVSCATACIRRLPCCQTRRDCRPAVSAGG